MKSFQTMSPSPFTFGNFRSVSHFWPRLSGKGSSSETRQTMSFSTGRIFLTSRNFP